MFKFFTLEIKKDNTNFEEKKSQSKAKRIIPMQNKTNKLSNQKRTKTIKKNEKKIDRHVTITPKRQG